MNRPDRGKEEKTEYMKGFEQGLCQAKARIKCWVIFDYMRGASVGAQEEFIDELNKALSRTLESYD